MLSNKSTKGKDEKPQKLRILPTFSPKTSQLAKPNSVIHSNTHTRAQREREREREREIPLVWRENVCVFGYICGEEEKMMKMKGKRESRD
jgi:hypothetical protein